MIRSIKRQFILMKFKRKYKKINTLILSNQVNPNLICGEGCTIGPNVFIEQDVKVGNFTYFNSGNSNIHIDSNVRIGNFCSIAPGVSIGMGNHYTSFVTTHPILYNEYYKDQFNLGDKQRFKTLVDHDKITTIGHDVWIGANAWLKRGITIGNGVVIAAGSVVTKDVPNYSIHGGIPSKSIGKRFTDEQIKALNEIENHWWNWTKEEISNNFDLLYDVDMYISYAKKRDK